MKYLILAIFLISSCTHQPLSHFDKPYPEAAKEIPYDFEFGFTLDNTKYNFGRVNAQVGEDVCTYFLGYKEGVLKYQFSMHQQEPLIKIFKENKPLNRKSRSLLAKIEEINLINKTETEKSKTSCNNIARNRNESIGYAIVFSPFLVILSPVIIPQTVMNQYQRHDISKKIKAVSLGQSRAAVEKSLGVPVRANSKEGYRVLSYTFTAYAPVFANYFFEDDKLVGYVSGVDSRPQTVIEQTK